jgi:superfamily II DNA/RNA helicase
MREPINRVLAFSRTKRAFDKVLRTLFKVGRSSEAIRDNASQSQRFRVLAAFCSGLRIVVTDSVARRIDVDGVSQVVNDGLPHVRENCTRRIGRTPLAGAAGAVISFAVSTKRVAADIPFLRRISERRVLSRANLGRVANERNGHTAHKHRRRKARTNQTQEVRSQAYAGYLLQRSTIIAHHAPSSALSVRMIRAGFEGETE